MYKRIYQLIKTQTQYTYCSLSLFYLNNILMSTLKYKNLITNNKMNQMRQLDTVHLIQLEEQDLHLYATVS